MPAAAFSESNFARNFAFAQVAVRQKSMHILTLLDAVADGFSPLLLLLAPFSISQRLPKVGLPRATRAPWSRRRLRLKSGNEKDERLRRILLLLFSSTFAGRFCWLLCGERDDFSFNLTFLCDSRFISLCKTQKFHSTYDARFLYVWIVMATHTIHPSTVPISLGGFFSLLHFVYYAIHCTHHVRSQFQFCLSRNMKKHKTSAINVST